MLLDTAWCSGGNVHFQSVAVGLPAHVLERMIGAKKSLYKHSLEFDFRVSSDTILLRVIPGRRKRLLFPC